MNNLNFLRPLSVSNKIRIGRKGDGGYVVYKPSLENIDVLLTYGVGWDVDFEIDFFNLTGKGVFMYDPTMFGDEYIDKTYCRRLLKKFKFQSFYKYIRFATKWKKHLEYLRKNDVVFCNEGIAAEKKNKFDTLSSHLSQNNISDKKILLKMDIEGSEYPILDNDDFYKNIQNIEQIVIEIHDLKNRLRELERIITKLKKYFEIVHIHGNNHSETFILYNEKGDVSFPDVIELTLVKKENIIPEDVLTTKMEYPVKGLDYENTPFKPPLGKLFFDQSDI